LDAVAFSEVRETLGEICTAGGTNGNAVWLPKP
jgi:hypothetical protein